MSLLDLVEKDEPLTVSQYTARMKGLLEREVPPCWVMGEVSNLRRQGSGHLYFSLKDQGAQLPAVMFRGNAVNLSFELTDGMLVVAFGEISVYAPHGRYQLIVRAMQASGEGKLYREFERLKSKLRDEGLFDAERKRSLPLLPLRLAVVTSPTGAALQDFLRVLKRRGWIGRLSIFPVKVQGEGSSKEIVEAVEMANHGERFDLMALIRGGGSIEDLWSFNEEKVVRAVAASAIPTLSGVGHEIDYTLCDFACDQRAETPSGAAEMISSLYSDTVSRLDETKRALDQIVDQRVESLKTSLVSQSTRLAAQSPVSALEKAFLRIDELDARFRSVARSEFQRIKDHLTRSKIRFSQIDLRTSLRDRADIVSDLALRIHNRVDAYLTETRQRARIAAAKLGAMSPQATLSRGYAMLENSKGELVTRASEPEIGDRLVARMSDGELELETRGKREYK